MHAVEECVEPPYLFRQAVDYRIILGPDGETQMRVRRHNFGEWRQRYDRLGSLLDADGLSRGNILKANCDLVDCEQMWTHALAALRKDAFFFVERGW